jgi:kynurenine formamidase
MDFPTNLREKGPDRGPSVHLAWFLSDTAPRGRHRVKPTRLHLVIVGLVCCQLLVACARDDATPWAGYTVVDMTHPFDADTIYWPTEGAFELEIGFEGVTDGGFYYTSNRYAAADHGGTHLDAPKHFAEGRLAADQVPLDSLMGPACVIDVAESALADPDYRLSVDDIETWEDQHGPIGAGCIVLLNTGYAQFWPDLHVPGFSEASAALLAERNVAAVGLDTPSIDYGQSTDFVVHQYLYDRNIPGFENVANIDALPATGGFVIALPMKIATGSGAPLRIVGLVPD